MTDDPTDNPRLAELHIDTIRRENDHVDERLEEYEATVSDLKDQVSDLEDEKADLEDEKEATEQLLAQFREGQRKKQLNRIREANEAVVEDNEVDLSTLEDADVDQLETVADMLETAAGNAGNVSNTDRTPDVGAGTEPGDAGGLEDRKAEVANEHGLGSLYQTVKEDDVDADHSALGAQTDGLSAADLIDAAAEGGN